MHQMPDCNCAYLANDELELLLSLLLVSCDACLQEVQQALVLLLEQSLQLQWWVGLCCWFWQPSSFAAAARGGTQEQLLWKLLR